MPTIHLARPGGGVWKVATPSRDTIEFPVSDPVYESSFWSRDLVIHLNGHFDGGDAVKMMHYHPGRLGSFGRFGLNFVDLLVRGGLLVSARKMNSRLPATALATKSGIYIFRDAQAVLDHLTDSSKYPDEGYYIDTECVIKGKILRGHLVED
jgi:hypothetical protein